MSFSRTALCQSQSQHAARSVDATCLPSSSYRCQSLSVQRRRLRYKSSRKVYCLTLTQRENLSAARLSQASWKADFRDQYVLGKNMGSGSYGVVHQCTDQVTKQKVAVKILPKVRTKQTRERTLRKLEREIILMAKVSKESTGITQLIDVYEDEKYVYIVMSLNEGGDLEAILESYGSFSEKAAAAVMYECLKIISVCHANGVLLGDIKPANFMLRQRSQNPLKAVESGQLGTAWLRAIDFGCSQIAGTAPLTRRTGTPVYMSPETFRREYHLEADMWSLGMMLYQLMAGRFPFWASIQQCRTRSLEEVMKAVIMDDIPLDYGPWLSFSPEGLDFLQGLLTRDPAQRLTAMQGLEHPWFRRHFGGASPHEDGSALPGRNNIVPLVPASPRCSFYSSSAASVLGGMPM